MAGTITDKDEIIKLAIEYLKENSICDLRDICDKNCPPSHSRITTYVRDIAYKMRRTGDFEIQIKNIDNDLTFEVLVWPVPHRSWTVRKPWLFALVMVVIGGLVSWLVAVATPKGPNLSDSQLQKLQSTQSDSLNILQRKFQQQLNDSIAAIRSDTTFLRK